MAEILVPDLTPGKFYHVQVRSVYAEGDKSSWSNDFIFYVDKDAVKPSPPTNLQIAAVGTAFTVSWDKPTTNADGTPLADLKDYEITVTAGNGVDKFKFYSATENWEYGLETNVANNNGEPAPILDIEVRARDSSDNLSAPVAGTMQNPPPAPPTGVVATGVLGGISVSWNANTEPDLKHYEVFASTTSGFTPAAANRIWRGQATNMTHSTLTIAPHYVVVRAVDVMNSGANAAAVTATPVDPFVVDTDAPPVPTNVAVTSALDTTLTFADITVTWTAVTASDLGGYKVRYSTSATGPWDYLDLPPDSVSARIPGLLTNTNYYVGVQSYDYSANYSAFANAATHLTAKDTAAPAAPSGVNMIASLTSVTMFWNDNAEADTMRGRGTYEAQVDTVNTFNSADLRTGTVNARVIVLDGLKASTAYFGRVRAIDANGNAGAWTTSTPSSVTLGTSYAGTIGGDIIAAGTLAGGSITAGTLDAGTLKANTAFNEDLFVAKTLTVGNSNASPGQIKSWDWNTTTGYSLTRSGLEIRSGTIHARALRLQDSANILDAVWATFEARADSYTTLTTTNGTAAVSTDRAMFGTQSLKQENTHATAECYTYLGTAYTTVLEPNTDYIWSAYVYPLSAASVDGYANMADGTHAYAVNASVTANSWQRISGVFNSGNNTAMRARVDTNTPGVTVYWDGIQIEKKVTGETAPSQWKPPSMTSIDGGLIRTGSISSTSLVNGQPAWAINMAGNATFANARINGTLVVDNSTGYSVQSGNYSAGSAGWMIRGDGYAEFRNVRVAGDISGSTGNFNGSLTVGNYGFNVDTSGNIWSGASTYANAASQGKFRVDSAGNLYASGVTVSGNITANAVSTGGVTIHSDGRLTSTYFNVSATGIASMTGATVSGDFTAGGNSGLRFDGNGLYLGSSDPNYANFWVTNGGTLYVRGSASIKGAIESGSTISGATITGSNIYGGSAVNTGVHIGPGSGTAAIRFYNGSYKSAFMYNDSQRLVIEGPGDWSGNYGYIEIPWGTGSLYINRGLSLAGGLGTASVNSTGVINGSGNIYAGLNVFAVQDVWADGIFRGGNAGAPQAAEWLTWAQGGRMGMDYNVGTGRLYIYYTDNNGTRYTRYVLTTAG